MLSWRRKVHVTLMFCSSEDSLGLCIECDYLLKFEVKKKSYLEIVYLEFSVFVCV